MRISFEGELATLRTLLSQALGEPAEKGAWRGQVDV